MPRFQHSDEVILAARDLMDALREDSPYGNKDEARKWADAYVPTVAMIAAQATGFDLAISEGRVEAAAQESE